MNKLCFVSVLRNVIAELPGLTVERAERVQRRVTDEDGRLRVQVDAVVRAVAPG